jgi:hypothetical protein
MIFFVEMSDTSLLIQWHVLSITSYYSRLLERIVVISHDTEQVVCGRLNRTDSVLSIYDPEICPANLRV